MCASLPGNQPVCEKQESAADNCLPLEGYLLSGLTAAEDACSGSATQWVRASVRRELGLAHPTKERHVLPGSA